LECNDRVAEFRALKLHKGECVSAPKARVVNNPTRGIPQSILMHFNCGIKYW